MLGPLWHGIRVQVSAALGRNSDAVDQYLDPRSTEYSHPFIMYASHAQSHQPRTGRLGHESYHLIMFAVR